MKNLIKIGLIMILSLALTAETNCCSIAQVANHKKAEAVETISKTNDLAEVNIWTLTNKFDF